MTHFSLMLTPISPGMVLSHRYRVVRQLGSGGFGRTYLVEDQNRFHERCVLKEFAPRSNEPNILQKSQQLFERESSILYQLRHPQIPRFRESFREVIHQQLLLFLVQDYIEGETYRTLLEKRMVQGRRFTEGECLDLMLEILPVLEYIHSLGVIHRDISPDNLMCRSQDHLPILIDFGGVKQVAINLVSTNENGGGITATRLGKMGYAPDEQIQLGKVSARSDLYSLAATILVLLTAKEPWDLIDPYTLQWNWSQDCSVSPQFVVILNKMLAHLPEDRYSSASDVLKVLKSIPRESSGHDFLTQPPPELQNRGGVIPTQNAPITPTLSARNSSPHNRQITFADRLLLGGIKTVLVLGTIVITANLGWWAGKSWLNLSVLLQKNAENSWRNRLEKLQIDEKFYISLVDDLFNRKYPELEGRKLTEDREDQLWREKWYKLGNELLDKLANLSQESRKNLGQYDVTLISQWKREVDQLNLSSRVLYDLADAKFFNWFPQVSREENLLDQPLGQIWQAMTEEQLKLLQKGYDIQEIKIPASSVSQWVNDTVKVGTGKVYLVALNRGGNLEVNLQPNAPGIRLAIYPPKDSKKSRSLLPSPYDTNWRGILEDSGYYELTVVCDTSQPISYELKLTRSPRDF